MRYVSYWNSVSDGGSVSDNWSSVCNSGGVSNNWSSVCISGTVSNNWSSMCYVSSVSNNWSATILLPSVTAEPMNYCKHMILNTFYCSPWTVFSAPKTPGWLWNIARRIRVGVCQCKRTR